MQRKDTIRKKPARRTIKQRALAIVNNKKYDADTRTSIAFQLKTNYSDLADMVRDAEQGVTICDLTNPATIKEPLPNANERLARAILEIMTNEESPKELLDRMCDYVCGMSNGDIIERFRQPQAVPAMENLLAFVRVKEARNEIS